MIVKNTLTRLTVITILFFSIVLVGYSQGPVSSHGALSVSGSQVVNQFGDAVSFGGNSFFWSNTSWEAEPFYNASCVNWLKTDWNSTIVRAAMGIEESGGYIDDPAGNKARVQTVVDAAIANDMYVIIDWHSHQAEQNQAAAIAFFEEMATIYGNSDNVIYEIYNEPLQVSWTSVVKPYAEAVIAAIRAIDPNNLIVVGTPFWSQDVDVASQNPIVGYSNIAYTLHFYAGSHGQSLRDKATTAMNNGIALFVTEWGTVDASGNGAVDEASTNLWMDFLCQNKLSHCNWSVHDKPEGASSLQPGASPTGGWTASDLTTSGTLVKSIIQTWDINCNAQVNLVTDDAGISSVTSPSGIICSDSIHPAITLNNYGSSDLTSATIFYNIDGGPDLTYAWNGTLTTGQSVTINLSTMFVSTGAHVLNVYSDSPNGVVDIVNGNDTSTAMFTSDASGTLVGLTLNTDCWGDEISWTLENESNVLIDSGSDYINGAEGDFVSTQYCLSNECFNFTINDSYGDGMNGMSNGCPINGEYDIVNLETGDTLATMIAVDGAFGSQEVNPFCLTSSCILLATTSVVNESCATMNDGAITATATSGTGPYSYTLGGVTNSTGLFENLTPGIHSGTMVDDNGCEGVFSETVIAAISFGSIGSEPTVCAGAQATLEAFGGTSYVWLEGGNSVGSNNTLMISPLVTTIYNVEISNGVCTEFYNLSVNVIDLPDAGFMTADFCQDASNEITDVMTLGGVFSYDGSDVSSLNTTSGLITNAVSGSTYTISYEITENGCSNQSSQTVQVNSSPFIDAGTDITICEGEAVILTAINPDNAFISWDNNVVDNISFNPIISGVYQVIAVLNGCEGTDNVLINVSALPIIDAGTDFSICSGDQTVLVATNPNNAQITWDNNVTNNVSFSPISTPITYTVTALLNGCSAMDEVIISTVNAPVVNAGADLNVCEGEVITLTATNPDNALVSWNNGITDGVSFTPQMGVEIYTVSANSNGCIATDDISVTVLEAPNVNAGIDIDICAGGQVTLIADNPDNAQITWDNNVTDNIAFVPTSSMTYTVTAMLNGCNATDQIIVTTTDIPVINAGVDISGCEGEVMTLTATNPDNALVSWNNGISDGVSFTPLMGVATYTVSANLNGCIATDDISVTVLEAPNVNAGTDIDICAGEQVNLIANNPNNADIIWDNGINDDELFDAQPGITVYTVTAEINGCITTDQVSVAGFTSPVITGVVSHDNGTNSGFIDVSVSSDYTIIAINWSNSETTEDIENLVAGTYIISVEDEKGCSTSEVFVVESSVGLSTNETSEFKVYPNPTEDFIQVEFDGTLEIKVLDMNGRILIETSGSNVITIDLSKLAQGVYFLTIGDNNQRIKISKI